jgi:transposase
MKPSRSHRRWGGLAAACRTGRTPIVATRIDAIQPKPRPGRTPKLPRDREAQFIERLDAGPLPSDGVCTLRGRDVVRILEQEFAAKYTLGGAYDLLERLGYSCLSPRPLHEKSDPRQIEQFKQHAPLL